MKNAKFGFRVSTPIAFNALWLRNEATCRKSKTSLEATMTGPCHPQFGVVC